MFCRIAMKLFFFGIALVTTFNSWVYAASFDEIEQRKIPQKHTLHFPHPEIVNNFLKNISSESKNQHHENQMIPAFMYEGVSWKLGAFDQKNLLQGAENSLSPTFQKMCTFSDPIQI